MASLPGGGGGPRIVGHGGNAAIAVNLDTGTHIDAKGHPHKTGPHDKASVGGHTMIFAAKMGHEVKPYKDHARDKTNVHKHLNRHAKTPHPDQVMLKVLPALQREQMGSLPGGGGR